MINVTAAIIQKGDKILIAERGPASFLGGKWEFPGGKVEKGEEFVECLKREIREELGAIISVGEPFQSVTHDYGEKGVIRLSSFMCRLLEGEPVASHSHSAIKWVGLDELSGFDFAPADIPIVKRLIDGLKIS